MTAGSCSVAIRRSRPLAAAVEGVQCRTDRPGQLRTYTYEAAARRCLTNWLLALRWQRLPAFQNLGFLLVRHPDGLLNYCDEKVPSGKVEAINGNIPAMLRRGRGYRDHEYLLPKVQKATATRHLRRTA